MAWLLQKTPAKVAQSMTQHHHQPYFELKVQGQDGTEARFKVKGTTKLRKLMEAYCNSKSLDVNTIAFLYDGRRLHGDHTPNEMRMEDGDVIDAMSHQTGGCTI